MPQNLSSKTEVHLNLNILTCDPLICEMNHPGLLYPNRMKIHSNKKGLDLRSKGH